MYGWDPQNRGPVRVDREYLPILRKQQVLENGSSNAAFLFAATDEGDRPRIEHSSLRIGLLGYSDAQAVRLTRAVFLSLVVRNSLL